MVFLHSVSAIVIFVYSVHTACITCLSVLEERSLLCCFLSFFPFLLFKLFLSEVRVTPAVQIIKQIGANL